MAAERVDAGLSTYETLIEKARKVVKTGSAAVLRSVDRRRVLALLELGGHESFRHVRSAWEEHQNAERHAVAESHTLALYRLAAVAGDGRIDPESRDAYAFESVACKPAVASRLVAPLASAAGFVGALIFGRDDDVSSAVIYRFEHFGEIDAFRAAPAALDILSPAGEAGESFVKVRPVKTFA